MISMVFADFSYAKKPIIIAVIDTGFAFTQESLAEKHLCKYGHKDFTPDQQWAKYLDTMDKIPLDMHSHGTHIVGIIDKNAGKSGYCFVIIKIFPRNTKEYNTVYSEEALKYINNLKPDIVNYSAGGPDFDQTEYEQIEKYLDRGGIFVAAAGNNGQNLNMKNNTYYPAMYDDRIKVVGNLQRNGSQHPTSNYGRMVRYWEIGTDVRAFGMTGSGTSQATAVETGKTVRELKRR